MVKPSLIKKVARGIRYKSLPDLIGQSAIVTGLESAEGEVRELLRQNLSGRFEVIPVKTNFLKGAIAKYGILDLGFIALDFSWGTDCETGITLLKHMNLVPKPSDDELAREMGIDVLKTMRQDIDGGKIFVRMFLETDMSVYSL